MNELGRYLTDGEREYRSERQKAVEKLDPLLLADSPFLYANRVTVTDAIARYELFKEILDVSGAIVECGVHKGNNLMLFSHLSSILEPYAINRKIIGFDSFDGFRSISSTKDPKGLSEQDFSGSDLSVIQKAVDLYDLNRAAGHMSRVELVQGDATKTIKDYVKTNPSLTVALLYIDFDIYEPSKVALEELFPLVCKGGIVAFDEFNYDKFPGETQAAKEFLDVNKASLKRFPFAPFIGYMRV